VLTTLKQPRYLGMFGLTIVIAALCVLAGTWQIARFGEKRSANDIYRSNNRAKVVDVGAALGAAHTPTELAALDATAKARDAHKFRRVTATGTYLTGRQTLLRGQTINNDIGYLVITPLQTPTGVLLVARGFVAQNNAADTSPRSVTAPPSGPVTITGRLQSVTTAIDRFGDLPGIQIDTIDASAQAARIGQPVYDGYAELLAGQPGTQGLTALPDPDMSNPAGGAEEPQHAAYVVQWYLFGGLALAAPFILAAAERRRDRDEDEPDARKPSLDDRLAGRT
jgi:cytochrome oxidase assembly protein ShyY1